MTNFVVTQMILKDKKSPHVFLIHSIFILTKEEKLPYGSQHIHLFKFCSFLDTKKTTEKNIIWLIIIGWSSYLAIIYVLLRF